MYLIGERDDPKIELMQNHFKGIMRVLVLDLNDVSKIIE
jgi:hypothetical protein